MLAFDKALLLGFSLFVYLMEIYISFRQLLKYSDQRATIPKMLEKYVTEKKFKETLTYGYDKLSFGMMESTFMLAESLCLVLLGYLPFVWDAASTVCERIGVCSSTSTYSDVIKEMLVTIVFLGLSSCHDTLIGLPFSLYSTFVIEERHGFNKTTLSLFFRDKALGLLLTLGIGAPILSGVVWLVRWGGEHFYFYVWGFLFVVSLVLMAVYPTLIAPLFNKYEKLDSGPVYAAIEELAKEVSFPLTQIYVVDGSKRSAHSNAYFYGFFKVS
jgi:STE24 endopeptidase